MHRLLFLLLQVEVLRICLAKENGNHLDGNENMGTTFSCDRDNRYSFFGTQKKGAKQLVLVEAEKDVT